jgi:O-antigen/teichoic acid export membrane protein
MPDQLLNELSVQSPVLLLQAFFSSSAVGLYALPQKFLSLPVAMVGNSIGQVFFRKAAILSEGTPELSLVTRRLFRFLFWLGVVPFSVLIVFGDAIFELFFGAEWVQSGLYAQLISPWLLFVLIGSPLSKLFTVQQRQGQSLVLNASLFCLRVAALLVGSLAFGSEAIAVGLFAAVSFFFWVFLAFYNLRLARVGVLPLAIEVVLGWGVTCAALFMVRLMIL